MFEDFPRAWDAWEISAYYKDKMWVADQVASLEVVEESTRKGIRMVKPYGDSAITQTTSPWRARPPPSTGRRRS